MIRRNFLKGLAAVIAAPSLLSKIKPKVPFLWKEYKADFVVTRGMIEDDVIYPGKIFQSNYSLFRTRVGEELEVGDLVALNDIGQVIKCTPDKFPVGIFKGIDINEAFIEPFNVYDNNHPKV